jgi:hypothetical protein
LSLNLNPCFRQIRKVNFGKSGNGLASPAKIWLPHRILLTFDLTLEN